MNEKILVGAIITNVSLDENGTGHLIIEFEKDEKKGEVSFSISEWLTVDKIVFDNVDIKIAYKTRKISDSSTQEIVRGLVRIQQPVRQLPFGWDTVKTK